MHTLKIYLMAIPEGTAINWQGIRSRLESMMDTLPMLRQRPVFVPFSLHHPVMIEDPDFDLDYHLCRAALPAPGGKRELESMIAQIASHALDQHRPLWEMWYIEGLEDGRVACVHKIHHTLADGMASVAYITRAWNQGFPETPEGGSNWVPEKIPSRRRLIWDALMDHVKEDARELPTFLKALYRAVRGMIAHSKEHDTATIRGISGELPRCRWNYSLSPKRNFATAQISLEDARELKGKLGGTINDVVMALAASTLREFLLYHDELPEVPLVASIPVSTDEKGSMRDFGNRTAAISTLLHVDIPDPIERYHAIMKSTGDGKEELNIMGRDTYRLLMHYMPPALLQSISYNKYRKRKADDPKYLPPSNISISNVPGPKEALNASDNIVSDLYSIGPLMDGMGMNITVWSYNGNLNFSVMGCKKALPDIHRITDGIAPALRELQERAKLQA
jgi:WS/DGAT/MGAT family acyltransferase